jgi:hypothetical protein
MRVYKCDYEKVDVYKTPKEIELFEYYQRKLYTHCFFNQRKTKKLIKEFNKDVELIRKSNEIYKN